MLIATGVAYRRLGVEPLEALVGHGVYYGAAVSAAREMEGRTSCGGWRQLRRPGRDPPGPLRPFGDHPGPPARTSTRPCRLPDPRDRLQPADLRTRPDQIADGGGDGAWTGSARRPRHRRGATGSRRRGLFLLLGAEPHCDWIPAEVCRDERGFVLTGRDIPKDRWADGVPPANLETTVPGIFAAGDVRGGSMKRVAAASGEGASVVPLVHAHLAP